jgi:3-hydroxyacyl-CoA dehydrogenase, C-terminal domain
LGRATSAVAIEQALAFYAALGKKPIHIRREIKGHVANRLQAALLREAFYLVSQGIASVSEVDTAIANGPGLRWALLGPLLNLHLSGGPGGIAQVLEHLGPPLEGWWHDLGTVALSTELNKRWPTAWMTSWPAPPWPYSPASEMLSCWACWSRRPRLTLGNLHRSKRRQRKTAEKPRFASFTPCVCWLAYTLATVFPRLK